MAFSRLRTAVLIGATAGTLWAGAATAQSAATIYRDPGFRGPAVSVERANPDMKLNFQVFSIRAQGKWELCPQPNFRGNCLIVGQNTSDLRQNYGWAGPLQSMRPVNDGRPPFPPPGGGNKPAAQSLRGMGAEFFPAPADNNGRVLACLRGANSAECASTSADRFCVSRGWRRAKHSAMETVSRQTFLADVLCVNTH